MTEEISYGEAVNALEDILDSAHLYFDLCDEPPYEGVRAKVCLFLESPRVKTMLFQYLRESGDL